MTPTVRRDLVVDADRLLASVGGVLDDVEEVEEYLTRVVHAVRAAVPGCDDVGVTVVTGDRPCTAAYTSAHTLLVDAVQYSLDEGPCLEAHETAALVRADLDELGARWPRFAEAVAGESARAVIALPLLAGEESVGALNLYARSSEALRRADVAALRRAAGRVGDVVAAFLALQEARTVAGQLEEAMASRAVIEQAKGVLMGRHGVTEVEAFDLLRLQSQRRNVKLRAIAADVVAAVQRPSSTT